MMSEPTKYVASTSMPVSATEAFNYHDRPGALLRLIPPWENVTVQETDNSLEVGSRVVIRTRFMGLPLKWVAEHTHYDPPRSFQDTQLSGPFAKWDHEHHFVECGEDQSLIRDQLSFRLPGGALGKFFGSGIVRKSIESMFSYRHQVTRDDLVLMDSHPTTPLSVAVSGASGLVGGQFCNLLSLLGHKPKRIVRSASKSDDEVAVWSDSYESQKLDNVDAVVHLAGKPIAGRWNDVVKKEIRDSRVAKTRQLCERLAALPNKPRVLVCASATGIYGNRGDDELNEDSALADDFLGQVARDWEAACQPAVEAGIRVVNARLGIVLSPKGGALQKMMLPAKLAGGALGNGKQWWSWIALDDVLGAIYHAIHDDSMRGPINLVAPEPIRNADFARVLGKVVGRPALFPAPAFMLRFALGEMADALLLSSSRVTPQRLMASNYEYRFTDLYSTLRYYLGKNRLESAE